MSERALGEIARELFTNLSQQEISATLNHRNTSRLDLCDRWRSGLPSRDRLPARVLDVCSPGSPIVAFDIAPAAVDPEQGTDRQQVEFRVGSAKEYNVSGGSALA